MKFDKTEFPVDSIVYFVERRHGEYKWHPTFGIVDDQWFNKVSVHYVVPKRITKYRSPYFDNATIEDVSQKYCFTRHKLPKGWDCDTKLFEDYYDQDEYDALHEALKNIKVSDPDSILKAMQDGILVRRDSFENNCVNASIDKDGYWYQVEPRNGIWAYHEPCDCTMDITALYTTYDAAAAEAKARNDELDRQAALTDYEWSVEQIDKALARWRHTYCVSEKDADDVRAQLLEMKNVENLEVSIDQGNIVWRYAGNNHWHNIAPRNW